MSASKSDPKQSISPAKRCVLRTLALAETDPQINALQPNPDCIEAINQEGLSLNDLIETLFEFYSARPALGERRYTMVQDPNNNRWVRDYQADFVTTSYGELQTRVKNLANAWRYHPEHRVAPDEFVCIIGFSGLDYVTADLACIYAQTVSVPLQAELGLQQLADIFANIAPAAVISNVDDLEIVTQLSIEQDSVRSLIVMDFEARSSHDNDALNAARKALEEAGSATRLIALDELMKTGAAHQWAPLPANPAGEERMVALIHSSGSTGVPKGAAMPERSIKMSWLGSRTQLPIVTICLAPLNHLIGRNTVVNTLSRGGTGFFTLKPDMSTLFDDIREVRPTHIAFFPRILELIYQQYQNEVTQRERNNNTNSAQIREQVKAEMGRSFLGDRLLSGAVGGAPVSPAVLEFMRDCFDILLVNVYGSTESGAGTITFNNRIQRPPVTDYRLRDVPELGYYRTDKPYPRGELCFKSTGTITQYYKQPEATKELFDEDGFQCTGDIVEERAQDHVVIIDRRKDVLKLSQGEFVAVGPLGTVFESGSAILKQVYIYGNSLRSYLLAVIVPDMDAIKTRLGGAPQASEWHSLIRQELQYVGQEESLKAFEIPRDFIFETEPFSQANGLLSSVRKRLRPALKLKYGERLEAMYEEADARQQHEIAALKDPDCKLTTLEKVGKLLQASLGLSEVDVTLDKTFTEWGGDSLGAVLFALSLEDVFAVEVPANTLLSPTGNPRRWAEYIDQAQVGLEQPTVTFSGVHGKNAQTILADDLALTKFIDNETLSDAKTLVMPADKPSDGPQTILLTGANGFLGRFVCLELLKKVSSHGGQLICLIRGENPAAARARLDSVFEGSDPQLQDDYQSLSANHLEVVAGDIADQRFGLNESEFAALAKQVDHVVHVAALVNHKLHYEHLFGPNVVGTAEVIRLALSTRLKSIDFVSTQAVESFLDRSNGNNEASPLLQKVTLSDHYAAGYGASKWAGEHLLQQANKQFGLPVNIIRGDMMLAHQRYSGQINTEDMFTRLLFSLIETGVAPNSFYQLNADGSRAKAHYDGVPVDAVAATVANTKIATDQAPQVFNIRNYHTDSGQSIDAFVDWIKASGYAIERIDEHHEWAQRFEQKLRALPNDKRQHSALNILNAYQAPHPSNITLAGCENFKTLYREINAGKDIPQLSRNYIEKCLDDMRALNLIAPVDTQGN